MHLSWGNHSEAVALEVHGPAIDHLTHKLHPHVIDVHHSLAQHILHILMHDLLDRAGYHNHVWV